MQARLPWHVPLALGATVVVHCLDRKIIALALPAMARDIGRTDRQPGG